MKKSESNLIPGRRSDLVMANEAATARKSSDVVRPAGRSVLTLLDASPTASVLMIGESLDRWQRIFPEGRFVKTVSGLQETSGFYDLIVFHCEGVATREDLPQALRSLHAMLKTTGYLMLYAPNAYTLSAIRAARGRACGRKGYRHSLDRAGFTKVYEYLALPTLIAAEEMVASGSRFLELPHHWHRIFHLSLRFRLFPLIADGYMYIAGTQSLEQGRLLKTVGALIGNANGQPVNRCTLERFDLRLRGAMILFVTEQNSGRHVVVRLVSDPETREIVRRNQTFLTALHGCSTLAKNLKAVLPHPIGECCLADTDVYVESLVEGEVAWKANRLQLRKQIQAEADEFIFQFQVGTRHKVRLDARRLDELLGDDLMRLDGYDEASPLRSRTVAAINSIKQKLLGQELFLSASHGDYGYGNILVDSRTGSLKGVIDWDTGRLADLPGIDFLNMEVQRIRIESGCDLSVAFQEMAAQSLMSGRLDSKADYQQQFGLTPDLLPTLLSYTLIRYLTRAAQYPDVFIAEQAQYLDAFDVLSQTAPL